MARPKAELTLSDDERQTLKSWASRPKSAQRLATRAKIVLACADGLGNQTVAFPDFTSGQWMYRKPTFALNDEY